jgi:non-ribosomal peptide synthetase component E (peptide arylation enzyme)
MRLHDFLEYFARERPAQDFAVMGDRRITYAEANQLANQLANAFIEAGLHKGITAGQKMLNYHQCEREQQTPVRNAPLRFSSPLSSFL